MELIFDFLVEGFMTVFAEGILEAFAYVTSCFIPEKKISEKASKGITIAAVIVSLALFVAFFVGIILLIATGGKGFWGWFLFSLGGIYLLLGITLKLISLMHKKKG